VAPSRRRIGFTLLELLVVLAILALLTGLLLAAVQQVRSAAAKTDCANRMRQIGLAFHNTHAARGTLPPGMSWKYQPEPYQYMSWRPRLLPYLEQDAMWRQSVAAYGTHNTYPPPSPPHPFALVVPAFVCPTDEKARSLGVVKGYDLPVGLSSYLGSSGSRHGRNNGVLFMDSAIRLTDITDGTSNTLLVGERPPSRDNQLGWWYAGIGQSYDGSAAATLSVRERAVSIWGLGCGDEPYHFTPGRLDNQCDAFHFWSLHAGGANFLFGDGSVRFLAYSADSVLPALATRAGGEVATIPD